MGLERTKKITVLGVSCWCPDIESTTAEALKQRIEEGIEFLCNYVMSSFFSVKKSGSLDSAWVIANSTNMWWSCFTQGKTAAVQHTYLCPCGQFGIPEHGKKTATEIETFLTALKKSDQSTEIHISWMQRRWGRLKVWLNNLWKGALLGLWR